MLKLTIATIVLAHGIGHVLFFAPTLRIASWAGQSGHSWALSPLLGDGLSRLAGAAIWVVAVGLFVAAVGGLVVDAGWWRAAAVAGAIVSIAGIVLMWDGIAPSNALLALGFDAIVLVALLWAHWPAAESLAAR